ncbi:hypothetical protein [uncultured Phenylobacterium sp.]|uniref:hypothetical protein n=1 Tax=uncultured Phenylobacterium sp. TaxID=349273 RepID=UPI0025E5474C|nr:hypothetical protein [uncultured Phenylobacterium sp.]
MRLIAIAAVAALLSGTSALAAPAAVNVSLTPQLQKKFDKTFGQREAELLTHDLRTSVEKQLAKTGAHDGARIELTLIDAKPNRPTFKQLGDRPGLSLESIGIGGAAIEGRIVAADGAETPIAYRWYETDIRQVRGGWTWSDATETFDRFARRLAKGEELARR